MVVVIVMVMMMNDDDTDVKNADSNHDENATHVAPGSYSDQTLTNSSR